MKKLCLLFFVISSSALFSQITANYDKYKVVSGSKNFYAEVYKTADNKYQLNVYDNIHKYSEWTNEYFYMSDYPSILSDRGVAFASIDRKYSADKPLVYIYYKGQAVYKYFAKDFDINEKDLVKTKNGDLWMNGKAYKFTNKKKKLLLKITTSGKKTFFIDTATGEFLKLK